MATATDVAPSRGSARLHVQKFGTFLSNMVLPNIGAFIAWGLITALFIRVGWVAEIGGLLGYEIPAEGEVVTGGYRWVAELGGWTNDPEAGPGLVGPMITYLLPLLIAFTGGRMVYDHRGGVVGAIATMGVIVGTSIPMFMGAMIMGPLGGWTMKRIDALWHDKIKPGFEMLVNNFAAGIWGMILAIFGYFVIGPFVTGFSNLAERLVDILVENSLLPLTSIFIEPAKVLFLNNAINQGILTPLGTAESVEEGKSILFLLEANPAAGLGLLLAFMFFGKGAARASAPGAIIIHFLGGIHEIYFPYVLMKPKLILAMIAGGATQIFINVIFDSGLRAPAAPGSIFAVYIQTASDSYVGVTLSVIGGAAASFAVAALLLKTDTAEDEGDLSAATADMEAMKGKKSLASSALGGGTGGAERVGTIKSIVFACDAGMGSSAMGASILRKKVHAAGFSDVTVVNKAISNLTDDIDLVVSHQDLTPRARQRTPSAIHVSVDNFMGSPRYDEIVELLQESNTPASVGATTAPAAAAPAAAAPAAAAPAEATDSGDDVLAEDSIVLSGSAGSRDDAIREAGQLLVAAGAVDPAYVDSMLEREQSVSTHMGNGLAIPHGTNEGKTAIRRTAISFVRYPDGVDWNGKPTKFVVGIAGQGNEHLPLLGKIAEVFVDKEQVARLEAAESIADVRRILGGIGT